MIENADSFFKIDSYGRCDDDDGDIFEQSLEDAEPDCVRPILRLAADKFGPTVLAAYERLLAAFPADSEYAEVAAFGRWARGKKGKPICLYVIALAMGLQRHADTQRKLNGGLPNGTHAAFPMCGTWVAGLLQKHGIRADMTLRSLADRVYAIFDALRDDKVRVLRLEADYRYSAKQAREFTVWTCAELDAKPAEPLPVVEPKPEVAVAVIATTIATEAREASADVEGQFEYELGALKAHAAHAPAGSVRRREFDRLADEMRGHLFAIRRERDKYADGLLKRPRRLRKPKGAGKVPKPPVVREVPEPVPV